MNIGFDLDNVFVSTPPFIPQKLIDRFYRKKTDGELAYRIPSQKEQLIRQMSHFPLFRPIIKKNLRILQSIPTNTHTLFLISSRFGFLKTQTENIVKKNKLDTIFHKIHFNYENKQPHIFKNELIKKFKIEKFVDDDIHLLKYIASRNNHVKLYWLNNKLNKKISKNILAVTNLSDILHK